MSLPYESLHNHTTASDGAQTYAEVLAAAQANGIGVVAFTDHDMLPTPADLAELKAYTGPVKWLLGCEISSGLPKELGGGPTGMFHILGLFTDPTNAALVEHCRQATAARVQRMESIVANLRRLGFTITVEDCLSASGGESVGRPHIVKALNLHAENAAIIEGLRADMEYAAKLDGQTAMAYMQMMQRDISDYPYRLFLSDDAFIPGVYVDYLYSIDMDASVKLIRDAGGAAVLAHWPTIWRKVTAHMLDGFLRDGRLDGVELRSGFYDSEVERAGRQLAEMAKKYGAITTIGIDGHRQVDIERFVKDRALAEATVGQTDRLVTRLKPNLSHSNL
jgi:predicted metal-dependent phosphoesterase TrpH